MTAKDESEAPVLVKTGIEGLDELLGGGLAQHRLYLVEGDPGSGKTTLALQFLLEGQRCGERCMFVTLSETREELRATAESHGWTLDGIEVLEILASEESLAPDSRYTMYHPSEVELGETTKAVLADAERIKPMRLVVDSLSEFRLLAENALRYRRQILAMKRQFARRGCTLLFVDDRTNGERDKPLHSLAHGVISIDRHTAEYGGIRRRLRISKLRAQEFREGFHDFVIRRGGLEVFPRLIAKDHSRSFAREVVESGLASLNKLLGGGLTRGTSTLIMGAAGTGKSALITQFAHRAAERKVHAALYLFDESIQTLIARSAGLGIDMQRYVENGQVSLQQIDPAEVSPGEFVHSLCQLVEKHSTSLVAIDSLNGYLNAMPSDRYLALHLHELLSYLGNKGVTTLLTMTQHGIVGVNSVPLDVSYVADTVIMLRYFEAFGEVRQAISVIKKRTGKHERSVRELRIDNGLQVGDPLRNFQGILSGTPEYVGEKLWEQERAHGPRTAN